MNTTDSTVKAPKDTYLYDFDDFVEVMTQKRMEILWNKARGFFLKDFKENYKNFLSKTLKEHPNYKYFSQGSIHDITNNAQLSYIDYSSKIIETDYITETMTDEEKTVALAKFKEDKTRAEKKEFNVKKQLFLYILNGNNPYVSKESDKYAIWGTLKEKFNLEPLRNNLLKSVFAMGKEVNKEINLFTYFEANNNPSKKKDFIMLVYIEKREKQEEKTKEKPKYRKNIKARELTDEEFEARAEVNLNSGNKKSYAKIAHEAKDKPQPVESKKFKADFKNLQKSSISKEDEHESDDETSFLSK
jgi:hypothetical protein